MPGGDLHLPQRDPGLKGAHDERRPQHVRVDRADSGSLGDRADPAVSGAPVEATAVVAEQDGARRPLADGQVDGAGRPRHQRDDRRFAALADDAQDAVAPLETEVLDVGPARLGDP
jgi:hypothetical protein